MTQKNKITNLIKNILLRLKNYSKTPAGAALTVCFFYCVLSLAAYLIAGLCPAAVTKLYTRGLYCVLTYPLKLFASLFPFSVAEILLFFIIIAVTAGFVAACVISIKKRKRKAKNVARPFTVWLSLLLCAALTAGGNFVWLGGMNYNAMSFKDMAGYNIINASAEELTRLCIFLRDRAVEAREALSENSDGVTVDSRSLKDILKESDSGYEKLSEVYDFFDGYTVTPKSALLSSLMSYEQISGIFPVVYTESLVNGDAPVYSAPHTACHELAHQFGFMREDEANFIGFLACTSSDDPLYVYSGYYSAFVTSMNQLYRYDGESWRKIYEETPQGLIRDVSFESEFWNSYRDKAPLIADISENVNDSYLRLNNIDDGTKSYGRMVDLLLAHYRETLR